MTPTEFSLFAIHKATAVKLEDICEKYLNMSPKVAQSRAALNQLPFPAFRLSDSQKAPWMIYTKDLADHIDKKRAEAAKQWELSQV